ncbi:MAG TPA: glycosyltransferase family 2 protein [Gemmatimonadaceae bacterium]|jgi:glycosyltransferase involved in cell wall biosynthesis|nr:glycosyltransferase family 2 protein [Gemmatimonadaceae bacterium]
MSSSRLLSVIVPVREGNATLARALNAILASELPRDSYELIVVDDASSDSSPELAARYADTVVRLTARKSGAAYARNRGAELAKGEFLAFVDADVMVRPDTLPRMLTMLADHPELDAVSASHDHAAGAENIVSQYWNLLLRFGEQRHAGTSGNVASPCAIIRRDVFHSAGMYDEWRFETERLEGIEFAQRLEESGRSVFSSRDIPITGLKQWNLLSLCREVWGRSALLARSLGYQRTRVAVPSDVVFTLSRALAPAFAVLCFLVISAAFVPTPNATIKAAIVLLGAIALNFPAYLSFARARGILFAFVVAPLHILMQAVNGLGLCAGWVLRDAVGDREPDATTQAYAEVGVEIWPPVPRANGR